MAIINSTAKLALYFITGFVQKLYIACMHDEWITSKTREQMKWFGTALFMVGSVIVSVSPALTNEWWPFMAFLGGHSLWAAAGLLMRDKAVLALNLMYIPLDVYAMIVRIA